MDVRTLVPGVLIAALGLLLAQGAWADEADMVRSKKCMSCHALDQKVLGPSFKSIAAKYADDAAAEPRLAKKIREGGSGVWGTLPMPANPDVNPAESQRLAHWVLMQK